MNKENCSTCKYRGSVPGSAHSCCNHPIFEEVPSIEEVLILKATLGYVNRNPLGLVANFKTEEGQQQQIPLQDWNESGITQGYVLYPFDFDPVWLNHCLLHTKIE